MRNDIRSIGWYLQESIPGRVNNGGEYRCGMAAVVAQCSNDVINEAAVGWRVFFFRKYYLLIAFVHMTHFLADSVEQKGDRDVRTVDTSVCRRRSAEFFWICGLTGNSESLVDENLPTPTDVDSVP